MKTFLFLALAGAGALALVRIPGAQIDVSRNEARSRFPEAITFYLTASSPSRIERVELEFGTDARACGESTARIVPEDFSPGTTVTTEWTWDLRRTGALPPGTAVWWHWVLHDASGGEMTTQDQSLEIEDDQHTWREMTAGLLHLHWYTGSSDFASTLLDAGEAALAKIHQAMGVEYDGDIRLYIYADASAMQSATLFAPEWSGGLAFPDHGAVLIAISPSELEWGRRSVAHELTHIVVGQYTLSCLNSTPPWVDEGLAMYTEGSLEASYVALLDEAIQHGTLLPVRSLGQIFSNDPELARLAYAQSYSLVAFLVDEYGPEKLVGLLDQFREGGSVDQALQREYLFDRDGLEAAWRSSIGAPPAEAVGTSEGEPTRTPYPTFVPLGGPNSPARTPTPFAGVNGAPTSGSSDNPAGGGPGLCAMPGVLGAAGLGIWLAPRRRRRLASHRGRRR